MIGTTTAEGKTYNEPSDIDANTLRDGVSRLIEKYRAKSVGGEKNLKEIHEANVRKDFIDPLFELLGWNVRDSNEYDAEQYVRGAGYVDVALKIDRRPVMFLEAKRFYGITSRIDRGVQTTLQGLKVYADWTEEERQVLNYAGLTVDVKWAVLTNFQKFRLFNAKTGEDVLDIESPEQYLERLQDLLLLTKRSVANHSTDKLEARRERPDVDVDFLSLLNDWRLKLARNMHNNCPELELEEVKRHVQRILDRFIIVRYAEDRWILSEPDQLMAAYQYWQKTKPLTKLTETLKSLFTGLDNEYDSRFFETDLSLDKVLDRIDSGVIAEIIKELYRQNFRKYSSDILGNTYESYLGHELFIKNGEVAIRQNAAIQKAGGVYYTPPQIVDFIVRSTLGSRLTTISKEVERAFNREEYSKAREIFLSSMKNLRVVDPACGSGSFLIRAFEQICDLYEEYNVKVSETNERISGKIDELRRAGKNKEAWELESARLTPFEDYEKTVLQDNIFGVDVDPQAAEIAAVNLMLKALRRGEKLPLILGGNIKCGNSLISADENTLIKFFGDAWKEKKSFNWKSEFTQVAGGFDIIIGNPPYVDIYTIPKEDRQYFMESDDYPTAYKKFDLYILFIERALSLLKEGGMMSFIIPDKFKFSPYAEKLRKYILENCTVNMIADFGSLKVFPESTVRNIVFVFTKETRKEVRDEHQIQVLSISEIRPTMRWKMVKMPQRLFLEFPACEFRLQLFDKTLREALSKIEAETRPLGEIFYVNWGLRTGTDEKTRQMIVTQRKDPRCKPLIRGDNILGKYSMKYTGEYIIYDDTKNGLFNPMFRELFENSKVIVRKISGQRGLFATFDDTGKYCFSTIIVCLPYHLVKDVPRARVKPGQAEASRKYDSKYVLALINSELMDFYYRQMVGDELSVVPNHVKRLPIRWATPDVQRRLSKWVDSILLMRAQVDELKTSFDDFLEPVIDYDRLQTYIRALSAQMKQFSNLDLRGKITRVTADETADGWLKIAVDFVARDGRSRSNVEVVKTKFQDSAITNFILNVVRGCKKHLGTGNLGTQVLAIKVPKFKKDPEENRQTIKMIVDNFLQNCGKRDELEAKIAETSASIDNEVFALYELADDEIRLIRSSNQMLTKT